MFNFIFYNMKRIKSLILLISVFASVWVSCQDDGVAGADVTKSDSQEENNASVGEPIVIYDTISYPVSKAIVMTKKSSVYCANDGCEPKKHTTIKIKRRGGSVVQEWLYEDLRTDYFSFYTWADDPTGDKYGYYYKWEGELFDLIQDDWDFLMLKSQDVDGEHELNFHIPTFQDLCNLLEIVGDNGHVHKYLNLTYACNYDPLLDKGKECTNKTAAMIWIDYPGRLLGCGVFKAWSLEPSTSYICCTNIARLACNVRLVRTLKPEEW